MTATTIAAVYSNPRADSVFVCVAVFVATAAFALLLLLKLLVLSPSMQHKKLLADICQYKTIFGDGQRIWLQSERATWSWCSCCR